MALPIRDLDDRRFQDIVDEAKKRITASCPEWTDHNVSDPGVTLVELFAWMTEMVIYRLNQVPEKNYIKLLELLGLKLREPESARVPLTFYLSAPQLHTVVIPVGTEAATVRTETRPSVVFSTDEDLALHPPALMALFTREVPDGAAEKPKDHVQALQQLGVSTFLAFNKPPKIGNALYFGFENDLSSHVLGVEDIPHPGIIAGFPYGVRSVVRTPARPPPDQAHVPRARPERSHPAALPGPERGQQRAVGQTHG